MAKKWVRRFGWMALGIGALYGFSALAGAVSGGTLDPPGPVGSTMKSLADIAPSWHQTLSSSGGCTSARFNCVMGGGAVLDNETGLVWEKTPVYSAPSTWDLAATVCTSLQTGGRFGWRLPTAEELLSVKDPAQADGLPPGNPFINVTGNTYWSATTDPLDASRARWVAITQFASNEQTASKAQYTLAGAWCVRGGSGFDAQVDNGLQPWSRTLPANDGIDSCNSSRFTCVLGNQAVLDHETGLVWQRNTNFGDSTTRNLNVADGACAETSIAGRTGWRLPKASELGSLLDISVSPSLPAGHPFQNPIGAFLNGYWTSTPAIGGGGLYYYGTLSSVIPPFEGGIGATSTNATIYTWCVRGVAGD